MIYRFVSKDSNVVRIGAVDAEALEEKLKVYLDGGYELAEAEAFDKQLIDGTIQATENLEKTESETSTT